MDTVDERTFKEKFIDCKNKVKWKIQDGVKWIKNNPKEAAIIVAGAGATVKGIYKISKIVVNAVDDKNRRKEVYCNDIQSTVKLKHELNYNECRELRDRMDSGQTKFEALDCMNLLKK